MPMRRYSLQQFIRSKFFFILGVVLCVFIALNFVKVFSKSYTTRQDIKRLKNEIADLEKNQERLQKFYTLLSSDFFAEKEARLKFGLQKQGERAVVIQENSAAIIQEQSNNLSFPSVSNNDSSIVNIKKQNNPKLWWDYFFSIQE
jgi:cell division protein FtsL